MKTNLQKFKDLLDELGVKYQIDNHAGDIKELEIYPEHLYQLNNGANNAVSVVFDSDDKLMYFEGMSWK